MKNTIATVVTAIIVVTLIALGFILGPINLSQNQLDTLLILGIICGCSALYCFVVGEITRNNSQMDKLWSILPIAYAWVIAAKGNFSARLVVYAIVVTLWGVRLTFNFARKGAYSLKFWAGEEDYRWVRLRQTSPFNKRPVWALFNLFFISIYQNALVLAITLPALAAMDSTVAFGMWDGLAIGFGLFFLFFETIADEQQMAFYNVRKTLLSEGKTLEELPYPYCLGFNTIGMWSCYRHPNYLGEQGMWVSLYFVVLGAGAASYGAFSWTMVGPLLLVFLFQGSSTLGEKFSSAKYPKYKNYQAQVFKYLPFRKYKDQ